MTSASMTPDEAYRVYWAATYNLEMYEIGVYHADREIRELYLVLLKLAREYQTRALNAWCHSEEAYE